MDKKKRKASVPAQERERFSVGAQISADEYASLEEQRRVRGCTFSDLVRGALEIDEKTPVRPLLVAAGQLIRAGNAHATAIREGNWRAAVARIDQLNVYAAELIRLAVEERSSR